MRFTKVSALAVTAALFAGCSSGSSSIAPVARPSVANLPASLKSAARLVLTLNTHKSTKRYALGSRKPNYVSSSTAGIIAAASNPDIASGATQYQGYSLAPSASATPTSPTVDNPDSCTQADATTGAYTCTLYFTLAPDANAYSVTLTAYDVAQSGMTGTPAANSNALSIDTENVTVAANTANSTAFALQGIVRGFYAARQYMGVPNAAPFVATPSPTPSIAPAIAPAIVAATPTPSPTPTAAPTATPTAVPTMFAVTFLPLDADGNPITGTTNLAYYNGSTFVQNATFNAQVSDYHCLTEPCFQASGNTAITSGSTGTIVVSYNGMSDPGTGGASSNAPPGFGQVLVNAPSDYVGNTSVGGTAATEYIEPFFPQVDQSSSLAQGESTVVFTAAGQSITAYGLQANQNSGAAGYSIDATDCSNNANGDIADVTNQAPNLEPNISQTVAFGTMFTISAGSVAPPASGAPNYTCVIRVYDNTPPGTTAVPADEADIFVSYGPNGTKIVVPGGNPGTPNLRTRGSH